MTFADARRDNSTPQVVYVADMALKTAEEYLDSLRGRALRVFYRGEPMDVLEHPVARPAAACVAEVYRAAQDPALAPLIVARSARGEPINASNLLWRSREDLVARVKWERAIGRSTGRGALRSPGLDAINALAVVTHRCDRERGTHYHARLLAFVDRAQREDLAVSGATLLLRRWRWTSGWRCSGCWSF
jgi:4-hydroxybutyryl-CoA dehydratase/vinylacetyl-CoA-Delta-isomerase